MFGMTSKSAFMKIVMALALLVLPLFGTVARVSAQDSGLVDDGTFVVELTGEEITWENDWTIDEEGIVQDSDFETFSLSGDLGLYYVTYLAASGDPGAGLEAFLEGFTSGLGEIENVDADDTADGAYSLDTVTGDDDLLVSFFSVATEVEDYFRVVTSVSDPESIGDAVDLAKSTIEYDGDDAFADIDSVTDTRVTLATSSPDEEEDAETPEADEEDTTPEADEEEATTPEPDEDEDAETPESDGADQSGESSYTFELNNAEVEWQEPWVIDDSLNVVESDYESIGFLGDAYIQSVIYLPTGIDLNDARDAFIEGFASEDVGVQEIDRGAYDNVSYSLDLAEINGVLWGLFTVYIDDGEYVLSYATLAPEAELGEALDLAKETITINGEAIYNGVTGDGLQDLIDASADSFAPTDTVEGDADEDRETPEADETPEDEDSGNDADADEYLSTVRDSYDELVASEARFDELFGGGDLSDADIDELTEILELWLNAAADAESLEAPDGFEDLHQIYLEYTAALSEASVNFVGGLGSESGTAEQDEFLAKYSSARTNAEEYAVMLDELLTDAGA
jgi:hypothetical protein